MSKYLKIKNKVFDLMFPNDIKCIFCGRELNDKVEFCTCDDCFKDLPFIQNACPKCGSKKLFNYFGVCGKCKRNNFVFKQAISTFEYVGKPLELVHRLKYNGAQYLVDHIANFMICNFATSSIFPDLITCVPMHKTKLKIRGYNQSELIAKRVAELSQIKYINLCEKIINTKSQTELDTKDRIKNVENSFAFNKQFKDEIKGKVVLIVDDVITTGATVNEISKVLLKSGAKECYALSFAHTSLKN